MAMANKKILNRHDVRRYVEEKSDLTIEECYKIYEERYKLKGIENKSYENFIKLDKEQKLNFEVIGLSTLKDPSNKIYKKLSGNKYYFDHFVMNIFTDKKEYTMYISHQNKFTNVYNSYIDVNNEENCYKREWPKQAVILKGNFFASFKDILDICVLHFISFDYLRDNNSYPENCNGICGTILWNFCKYYKESGLLNANFFHREELYKILDGQCKAKNIDCVRDQDRSRSPERSDKPERSRGDRDRSRNRFMSKSKKSKSKKSKSKKSKTKKSKSKKSKSKKSKSKNLKEVTSKYN